MQYGTKMSKPMSARQAPILPITANPEMTQSLGCLSQWADSRTMPSPPRSPLTQSRDSKAAWDDGTFRYPADREELVLEPEMAEMTLKAGASQYS